MEARMVTSSTGAMAIAFLLLAAHATAQLPEPRMIVVEGHPMRVRTAGLDRSEPKVTLVFEVALGDRLETWDSLFQQAAVLASVVTYDRAGLGGSPDNGVTPSPANVARTLHALLAAVGAKPPYVFVGHSWGGLLARMFIELYPSEVAGLVYIDPTDTRTLADEEEYYREQGYVGAAMAERRASLLRFRGADRGEFKVLVDTVQSDFKDFRSLRPLTDVPMAVFMSASFDPISWRTSPCAPRVCEEAVIKWRIKWLREMMIGSSDATLTIATTVRHHMHVDDPDLIVSGIRRVLNAASRRSR
jgi:pimeloyl-ACP methyl ester carboxylesterase